MRIALGRHLSSRRLQPILAMYRPPSIAAARQAALRAGLANVDVFARRRDSHVDTEGLLSRFVSVAGYMLDPLGDAERTRVLANFRQLVLEQAGAEGTADFDYSVTLTATKAR